MAAIGINRQTEEMSWVSADSKISHDQIEDVESGAKRVQLNEERVILTEQDVSFVPLRNILATRLSY